MSPGPNGGYGYGWRGPHQPCPYLPLGSRARQQGGRTPPSGGGVDLRDSDHQAEVNSEDGPHQGQQDNRVGEVTHEKRHVCPVPFLHFGMCPWSVISCWCGCDVLVSSESGVVFPGARRRGGSTPGIRRRLERLVGRLEREPKRPPEQQGCKRGWQQGCKHAVHQQQGCKHGTEVPVRGQLSANNQQRHPATVSEQSTTTSTGSMAASME